MPIYQCEKCEKIYNNKTDFTRHLNRKTLCTKIYIEFKCDKCLKLFLSNQHLERHKNKKIPCTSAIVKLENEVKLLKIQNIINNSNDTNTINDIINYVYLLQDRASIDSCSDVFKIGRTNQDNLKRLSGYQKGSRFLLLIECNDCKICEQQILTLFKINYIQDKSYGNEYFKGDYKKMILDIMNIVLKL